MKRYFLLSAILLVALFAYAQQQMTAELRAEQASVSVLMNKVTTAFKEQNADILISLLTEDALILGSDPSEFFNKQQTAEVWSQMFAEPFPINFTGETKIKMAPDGHSAFAVHQYFAPVYSEKMQFRNSYHLIKVNKEWRIFTIDISCIPRNDDFTKINEALKMEN